MRTGTMVSDVSAASVRRDIAADARGAVRNGKRALRCADTMSYGRASPKLRSSRRLPGLQGRARAGLHSQRGVARARSVSRDSQLGMHRRIRRRGEGLLQLLPASSGVGVAKQQGDRRAACLARVVVECAVSSASEGRRGAAIELGSWFEKSAAAARHRRAAAARVEERTAAARERIALAREL